MRREGRREGWKGGRGGWTRGVGGWEEVPMDRKGKEGALRAKLSETFATVYGCVSVPTELR